MGYVQIVYTWFWVTASFIIPMWYSTSKGGILQKVNFEFFIWCINPNAAKSNKIVQNLSPKHAAHGFAQSPYPIYRHGKACLSKQPPWRAAGDPRLACGRSRVRTLGPAGALRTIFFSTLPSFLLWEIIFSHLPHQTHGHVRVMLHYWLGVL